MQQRSCGCAYAFKVWLSSSVPTYRTVLLAYRYVGGAKGVEGRTYRTGAYRDGITIPLSGDGTFWYGRYAPHAGGSTDDGWRRYWLRTGVAIGI